MFSSYLNRWFLPKSNNHWRKGQKFFIYKQPIIYYLDDLKDEFFSLSTKNKKAICLKKGLFRYPIFNYSKRINIVVHNHRDRIFTNLTIDDDDFRVRYEKWCTGEDLEMLFVHHYKSLDLLDKVKSLVDDSKVGYFFD